MIQVKDAAPPDWHGSSLCAMPSGGKTLLKTYMLRFRITGGGVEYQPVLCDGNAAALAAARGGLELRPECEIVDVLLGDAEILQLARAD